MKEVFYGIDVICNIRRPTGRSLIPSHALGPSTRHVVRGAGGGSADRCDDLVLLRGPNVHGCMALLASLSVEQLLLAG